MQYTDEQLREHVLEIQQYLHAIAYFDSTIPTVVPSGYYGASTNVAVRAFQRKYNLPETGAIDQATWEKIVSVYGDVIGISTIPLKAFPSKDYIANFGDSGFLIYTIQTMLSMLGDRFDNLSPVTINGTFDEDTREAVIDFQELSQLEPSGNVDHKTWNMLAQTINHIK